MHLLWCVCVCLHLFFRPSLPPPMAENASWVPKSVSPFFLVAQLDDIAQRPSSDCGHVTKTFRQ